MGVSLDIGQGERHAIIGPERRGQDDALQPHQRAVSRLGRPHRARREADRRAGSARDQPARAVAELPGHLDLLPPDRVRERPLRLLWSRGYRYSFWHLSGRERALNEAAERLLESVNLQTRRDVPAGLLTYAEQRALEIGITIAGGADDHPARRAHGGDEPQRGRSRGGADPPRDRGQDPRHGRARHERGVRRRRQW